MHLHRADAVDVRRGVAHRVDGVVARTRRDDGGDVAAVDRDGDLSDARAGDAALDSLLQVGFDRGLAEERSRSAENEWDDDERRPPRPTESGVVLSLIHI